jgi:flavodoxin
MGKALIVFFSRGGHTKQMAEYIAEGIRLTGNEAVVKKTSEIENHDDIEGYDAYAFGSPTYHRDMVESMKKFLFLAEKAGLQGKAGGAFGSYTHSGDAPKIIFDTMEFVFKMNVSKLGSFNLLEDKIDTDEGLRACQDYGKALIEMI